MNKLCSFCTFFKLTIEFPIMRLLVAMGMAVSLVLVVKTEGCDIPAIYNFGDSNSDTGGIAAAFFPMRSPCGHTFFHRPAGRASDGRLIIDFIAESVGIPYLSAYLDSIKANYRHGANFATGGATIMHVNESWFQNNASPFPLDIQVEHFIQFKRRTTFFYNQANGTSVTERSTLPRPEDFTKALYIIDIGQNDIAVGLRTVGLEQTRAIIPDIVNQFAASVKQLHQQGGRAFWVHNTGPLGCLPLTHVKLKDPAREHLDEIGCVKDINGLAMEFNKKLLQKIIKLRSKLPQATLTYVDMYTAKYELITNAKDLGFEDRFTICCGRHDLRNDVYCGNKGRINNTEVFAGACLNPSRVISWDGVHYSEAANHWIAKRIVNGSLSKPPISITQTCP